MSPVVRHLLSIAVTLGLAGLCYFLRVHASTAYFVGAVAGWISARLLDPDHWRNR